MRGGKAQEWAFKGVHDLVLSVVSTEVPVGSSVLDIACGPGALSRRLLEKGYKVTAADGFPEVFQFRDLIPFVEQNVEGDWCNVGGGFDAVCAVEIIEHVENPYLFIRRCFAALGPGGVLILTTPNASYYSSRMRFLHVSEFEFYSTKSFSVETKTGLGSILPGHINCFTSWMLDANLRRAGFVDTKRCYNNDVLRGLTPVPLRPLNFLRHLYYRLGVLPLIPLMLLGGSESLFSKNIVAVGTKPRARGE